MCPSHLKEPSFCTPISDQAAVEAKKKKELEEEVERVKKEYEEKQRKKKEKEEAEKSKDKDKDKEKEKESEEKTNESKKPSTPEKVRGSFDISSESSKKLTISPADREYSEGGRRASGLCASQVRTHFIHDQIKWLSSACSLSLHDLLILNQIILPKPSRHETTSRDGQAIP